MLKLQFLPKPHLTAMPDTLYSNVAMSSGASHFENTPTERRGASPAPIIWGLLLPPGVTLIGAAAFWEADALRGWSEESQQPLLVALLIAGMTLLCSTLFCCCLPVRTFGTRIREFRRCLIVAALATLFALVVGGGMIAEMSGGYYYHDYEGAMFLILLLVATCATPLWLSVKKLEDRRAQALILGGFLTATVLTQLSILKSGRDYQDERAWMLNSVLVGLAFAIWLCAWGAKEFRRN